MKTPNCNYSEAIWKYSEWYKPDNTTCEEDTKKHVRTGTGKFLFQKQNTIQETSMAQEQPHVMLKKELVAKFVRNNNKKKDNYLIVPKFLTVSILQFY